MDHVKAIETTKSGGKQITIPANVYRSTEIDRLCRKLRGKEDIDTVSQRTILKIITLEKSPSSSKKKKPKPPKKRRSRRRSKKLMQDSEYECSSEEEEEEDEEEDEEEGDSASDSESDIEIIDERKQNWTPETGFDIETRGTPAKIHIFDLLFNETDWNTIAGTQAQEHILAFLNQKIEHETIKHVKHEQTIFMIDILEEPMPNVAKLMYLLQCLQNQNLALFIIMHPTILNKPQTKFMSTFLSKVSDSKDNSITRYSLEKNFNSLRCVDGYSVTVFAAQKKIVINSKRFGNGHWMYRPPMGRTTILLQTLIQNNHSKQLVQTKSPHDI